MTNHHVLEFREIDRTQVALVGGKGANLGELSRIEGIRVPSGFCVTTETFQRVLAEALSVESSTTTSSAAAQQADVRALGAQLTQLSRLSSDDREAIRTLSAEIRRIIEEFVVSDDVAVEITAQLKRIGAQSAYAVRSSATAEDLSSASFAGQQDTYLNVVGATAILQHVSRCWASLFTERAVTYRIRHGVDHRKVHMAVVVQQMVFPHASGILFTADPITGNRTVTSIDASFGLGEALVSGLVNPDVFKVRNGAIVSKTIGTKKLAVRPSNEGGTHHQLIAAADQDQPSLTDAQVVRLAVLGRQIEAHFGRPQDIEWCLVDDDFQIVQSRPITTLFPIPEATDEGNHVYLSVGHNQMMTDPMKPLGLSFWNLTTPRPMAVAAGRLFVDVTQALASSVSRAGLLDMAGKTDPLVKDALQSVLDRGDFIRLMPDAPSGAEPSTGDPAGGGSGKGLPSRASSGPVANPPSPIEADPAIVTNLIERNNASIETLKRQIGVLSGSALVDFIIEDIRRLQQVLFDPESHRAIMAGMDATWWLNDQLHEWLGEKNAVDVLSQSAPNNVTSEMGLSLLDVADVIRPHADVVALLARVAAEAVANTGDPVQRFADKGTTSVGFLSELSSVSGGHESLRAIQGWLDKYGMRGVGEIDITRPRWSERPTMLVPLILANVKNFAHGEAKRRFDRGLQEARKKEGELLGRLRALPDGEKKAEETKRIIDRLRTFIGYREYPKYGKVCGYFVYKQALLREAERLVETRQLQEKEDTFYLTLQELQAVERMQRVDQQLIRERKEAFKSYALLGPPRVLTSEGEGINGAYRRDDYPAGALAGLAVSAGTVEGRARVILDMAKADLEPGDILVTAYTDPSWTPLFVAISGLITEVGGLMTHGAVIAREYGLPAVVGVENATRLIRDGQRVRVNGTEGWVVLLDYQVDIR
ncbi:MAG: rifamycin-inactivating phosphotransferase [Gemmatimonas sp.]